MGFANPTRSVPGFFHGASGPVQPLRPTEDLAGARAVWWVSLILGLWLELLSIGTESPHEILRPVGIGWGSHFAENREITLKEVQMLRLGTQSLRVIHEEPPQLKGHVGALLGSCCAPDRDLEAFHLPGDCFALFPPLLLKLCCDLSAGRPDRAQSSYERSDKSGSSGNQYSRIDPA